MIDTDVYEMIYSTVIIKNIHCVHKNNSYQRADLAENHKNKIIVLAFVIQETLL